MPWARTDWMSERLKFIATYLDAEVSFTDLCLDFGISRKTGYKWVRRYEADGVSALNERSRAPRDHPNAVAADMVQAIVTLRRKHLRWGPRKLRGYWEGSGRGACCRLPARLATFSSATDWSVLGVGYDEALLTAIGYDSTLDPTRSGAPTSRAASRSGERVVIR